MSQSHEKLSIEKNHKGVIENKDTQEITESKETKDSKEHNDSQLTSGGLDLAEMEEMIMKSFPLIETAKGKKITLVLGNTGAGKSTLVHYLIGNKLRKEHNGIEDIAIPLFFEGRHHPLIGDGRNSVTLYPEVFESQEGDFFCDFPGFMDNRSLEEKICTSITSQMAIQFAESIQSIVVVININSLSVDRSASFVNLLETLNGLVDKQTDINTISKSMLFVFTKVNKKTTKNAVLKKIKELAEVAKNNMNKEIDLIKKATSTVDYDARKTTLDNLSSLTKVSQLILSAPDNILLANVFDDGTCRNQIITHLKKFELIKKEYLRFGARDETRVKFNEAIMAITSRGLFIMQEKNQYPSLIHETQKDIKDCREQIRFYEHQIVNIQVGKEKEKYVTELNNRIDRNKSRIETYTETIDELECEEKVLSKTVKNLNSNESVEYKALQFYESNVITNKGFVYNTYTHQFKCTAPGQILKVDEKLNNNQGKFTRSQIQSNDYTSTYEFTKKWLGSDYYDRATVNVYIRSKDHYKSTIEEKISQINKKKKLIEAHNIEIKRLQDENIALTKHIDAAASNSKEEQERHINAMQQTKKDVVKRLKKLEEETLPTYEKKLGRCEEEFLENQNLFKVTVSILRATLIDIPLAREFIKQYELANDKNINLIGINNIPFDIKCPITGRLMKDPVFISCGCAFEHIAISNYFSDLQVNKAELRCPNCCERLNQQELTPAKTIKKRIEEYEKQKEKDISTLTTITDENIMELDKEIERELIALEIKKEKLRQMKIEKSLNKSSSPISPKIHSDEKILELFKAVEEKKLLDLKRLHKEKRNFKSTNDQGETLLHKAASIGADSEILKFLIVECGCHLNAMDDKGETPLFQALTKEHLSAVSFLIDQGADLTYQYDVNTKNFPMTPDEKKDQSFNFSQEKITLLQYALKKELSIEFIESLVKNELAESDIKKSINKPLKFHKKPLLHLIAGFGNSEILFRFMKRFEEIGIDINVSDENGLTALCYAAKRGNENIVKMLLEANASFYGQSEVEKELLKNSNKHIQDRLQNHLAQQKNQEDNIKKQIEPFVKSIFLALYADSVIKKKDSSVPSHLEKVLEYALFHSPYFCQIKNRSKGKQGRVGLFDYIDERQKHKIPSVKLKLDDYLENSGFEFGEAEGGGDCFYDSIYQQAQQRKITLPSIKESKTSYSGVKLLRLLCEQAFTEELECDREQNQKELDKLKAHLEIMQSLSKKDEKISDPIISQIQTLQKKIELNSSNKGKWIKELHLKDSPNQLFEEYIKKIKYTASEIAELEKRQVIQGPATWGRPHIEGRVLCEKLGVSLHVVEIQETSEGAQLIHEFITSQGVVTGEEKEKLLQKKLGVDDKMLHLVVYSGTNHYVPLVKKSPSQSLLLKPAHSTDSKSETTIHFESFIKWRLMSELKSSPKEWEALLEKEKNKEEVKHSHKNTLIKITQNAVSDYSKNSDFQTSIEIIAREIVFDIKSNKLFCPDSLYEWIIREFLSDTRLKQLTLDLPALKKSIYQEILYSSQEKIDVTQQAPIYSLRIRSGISNWLALAEFSTNISYVIAKNIVEKLRAYCQTLHDKKGMKDKKMGIACYLIQGLLDAHPKDIPIIHFLERNPKLVDKFINTLFENLKSNAMTDFSIETKKQEEFKDEIRYQISNWLSSMQEVRRQNYLLNTISTKQEFFVAYFCQEFEKFYCMYKALGSKLVRRLESAEDRLADRARDHSDSTINIRGFDVPIGTMAVFFTTLLQWRRDNNIEKAAKRINWLFGSRRLDENGSLIKMAADYIKHRYEMQINALTSESIEPFAQSAARRAIQYIIDSDENLMRNPPTIIARIQNSFSNFMADKKYGPVKLTDFKDPISAIITGVVEGTAPGEDDTHLSAENGTAWIPRAIFHNVGYIFKHKEKGYQIYNHQSIPKFSNQTNSIENHIARYGYCWIEEWEIDYIKKAGYTIDPKVTIDDILRCFPLARSSDIGLEQVSSNSPVLVNKL